VCIVHLPPDDRTVSEHATAWTAAAAASAVDADAKVASYNDAEMFGCRRAGAVPFINSFAASDRHYVRLRDGRVSEMSDNDLQLFMSITICQGCIPLFCSGHLELSAKNSY